MMKILLLGKGKSIKYIKKYLKHNKVDIIHAVFKEEYNKKYLLADESLLKLNDIDYVIKSPGIKETNKLYLKLKFKFKFINELDLLKLFNVNIKSIVVTGSNGKTTFVSMLKHIFDKLKIKSILCGNSFEPISKYYKKFNKVEYLIIEQSSFQLHNLSLYNPYISLILNLQENHLDDSYSLNSYYQNKMNIFKYQNKNNYFIYDDNPLISLKNSNVNIINKLSYEGINKLNDSLLIYKDNIDYIYTILKILNINENSILYLNTFKKVKYRLNNKTVNNTLIINDSKSTSLDATLFALNSIDSNKNIILIVGGKDKNLSYERLNNIKVKYLISYGSINNKVKKSFKSVLLANNIKHAFYIAISLKLDNKVILFSPSTSSFEEFKNFEERGAYFNKLIKKYEKNKL